MPSIQSRWLFAWALGLAVMVSLGTSPMGEAGLGDYQAILSAEAGRWASIVTRLDWFPRRAAWGKPQDLSEESVAFDPDERAWYVTIDGQPGVPQGWSGLLIWKERSNPEAARGALQKEGGQDRRIWWFFRGIPGRSGWDAPLEMEGWLSHGTRGSRVVFAASDPGRVRGDPPQWSYRFVPAAPLVPGAHTKKLHAQQRNARSGEPEWTTGNERLDQGLPLEG